MSEKDSLTYTDDEGNTYTLIEPDYEEDLDYFEDYEEYYPEVD